MRVTVKPYNPQWASDFLQIKSDLEKGLEGVPYISIEHFGSTSIPGLAAKPTIDIDIVVSRENVSDAIAACVAIGYEERGQNYIPDRHALRAEWLKPPRNLYVCVEGCLALKNHRAIRDQLRKDEELRDEYAAVKLQLAHRDLDNFQEYCDGKNEIINKILDKSGMIEQGELAEIKRVNAKSPLGWTR